MLKKEKIFGFRELHQSLDLTMGREEADWPTFGGMLERLSSFPEVDNRKFCTSEGRIAVSVVDNTNAV